MKRIKLSLQNFQTSIRKTIIKIEKKPINFWYFFITLVSIIFLRQFLETFSDPDNSWQILPGQAFIHYSLFFVAIFFSLALVIKIITKEEILKVTKTILIFFPIILAPPIIDLVLSGGEGINMAYILDQNVKELAKLFFTFFRDQDSGISPGMKIEITLGCLAAALYTYIKKRTIFSSMAALFSTYTITFIYVSLPNIIFLFWGIEFSNQTLSWKLEQFDRLFTFVYLLITLIQLVLFLFFYNKQKLWSLAKNIRFCRLTHYEAMLFGGIFLSNILFDYKFETWQLLAAAISLFLAWLSMVGLNDINDVEIDAISNKKRPLVQKVITIQEYKIITFLQAFLALLFAYTISYQFLIFILIFLIIYTIYSAPPLKLKRFSLLATFLIACATLIVFMAGFSLPKKEYLIDFPRYIITLILVTFTLSANVKDIKDLDGDKKAGILTIPVIFGEELGKKIIGALVFFSYIFTPLILPRFFPTFLCLSALFGIINYFLITQKHYQEKYIFFSYFCFFGVLVYYLNQIYR